MSFRRSPNFVARTVGEHHVLLPVEGALPDDVYVFLLDGPVALALWDALSVSRSQRELVDTVLAAFEVEREQAEADVATFLEQLSAAGCLDTAD